MNSREQSTKTSKPHLAQALLRFALPAWIVRDWEAFLAVRTTLVAVPVLVLSLACGEGQESAPTAEERSTAQVAAAAFVVEDVEICGPAAEIRDPEIDVSSKRMVFVDVKMRLKLANIRNNATLGVVGCSGQTIDTGVTIALPGITFRTFRNGAEWGRSQSGVELVYAKVDPEGQPQLARARFSGSDWLTELLDGGNHRHFPVATTNQADAQARLFYWRLNEDGSATTVWREEGNASETEREFPGFVGNDSGGSPRWIPGERAITTVVPDEDGVMQAARYFIDDDVLEVMTSDTGNKDEVWMWRAPEFGDAWVFSTVVDGCCVRIYREAGATWELVHSFAASSLSSYGHIYSPEPFVYAGRSYLAMQFALTERFGPSNIWLAGIDPSAPLYRRISAADGVQIRNEPEWYSDANGAYVFYSHVTAAGFSFRRASTGL